MALRAILEHHTVFIGKALNLACKKLRAFFMSKVTEARHAHHFSIRQKAADLMRAIGIINAPWGANIGARHITVSTSGLVPRIRDLADAAKGVPPVVLPVHRHARL